MKVLIIGGTGLLGLEAAQQLLAKKQQVIGLALPPLPVGVSLPSGYQVIFKNYLNMGDDELLALMEGVQALVFAAGIDERVEGQHPIYDLYDKYNIQPVIRLLGLAKKAGVHSSVVLGSYFTYAHRLHPNWQLDKYHPYIAARIKQMEAALAYAEDGTMHVAVLELPYIFGVQPGRQPVWTILLEQILAMKRRTYYPKGGTAMVTVRQVGQAIVGAINKNHGGNAIPIGYYNMTWKQMLTLFHRYTGINRNIVTIPTWMYRLGVMLIVKKKKRQGIEMGLNMVKFSNVMTSNLFIDKNEGSKMLGVKPDDIQTAIANSIHLSMDAIKGKKLEKMKSE
ncbi:MAG TPA: NAD(P)-dependent oxidoreductase [Bacilli bacterium]|nr:NAD(P)-dependent oxidoreductase [Bacilli bacterium]